VRGKTNLLGWPWEFSSTPIEFVNIREQCAWAHADPDAATAKALRLVAAAVARVRLLADRPIGMRSLDRRVLVAGRGMAGQLCATYLVEHGVAVTKANGELRQVRGSAGAFAALIGGGESREETWVEADAIVLAPAGPEELETLLMSFPGPSLLGQNPAPWRLLETRRPGIFLLPPDGPAEVGVAASARVLALLGQGGIRERSVTAQVDPERCRACGTCEALCEFAGITVRPDATGRLVAQPDPVQCRGCGTCAAHCPSGAITAGYYTDEQIEATLKALLSYLPNDVDEENARWSECVNQES